MLKRIVTFLIGVILVSCNAQNNLVEGNEKVVFSENLQYYLYYPDDYFSDETKDFGILLFLHGGGEAGQELNALKKNGPPKMMADGYPFPFLVLAPQNPYAKQWWNIHTVNQLLDFVIENNRVDKNRIYLTGLSRGGSAAWDMAVQYPDKFAALAVVCGMTPTPYAHWLNKEMPIWVFHGTEDKVIPVSESDAMVRKLKALNFDIRYSRYEGVGHDSWTRAYATDELFEWLNQQNKSQ